MKLKKEYALLGIVILALGIYLFLNKRDRVHYTLPETPRIETADISRVEIQKAGGDLTLKRTDDGWRLSPGDYPADTAQVEQILKTVANLSVTALVSETQSYARYDLDAERRIEIRAYSNDRLVRQFTVGKAASTFRHTHVLLGEDKNVYHAAGSFRWEFDKAVDELRDKTVLTFDRSAVTAIELTAEGEQLVIAIESPAPEADTAEEPALEGDQTKSPPEARWVTAAGETIEATDVDQLLSALSPLKCSAFLDEAPQTMGDDPQYRLELKGLESKTLEIFSPAAETGSDFSARSSDSPYAFKLTEFEVAKIKDFFTAATGSGDEADTPATSQ